MKISIKGFDSTEIVDVATGFIARERNGELFVTGSKSWQCLGFQIVNNFGHTTKVMSCLEFYNALKHNKASLFYKNGKARFRVLDLDHGTRRVWGNRNFKHYHVNAA